MVKIKNLTEFFRLSFFKKNLLFLKNNHYHDIQFLHIGNLPEDGLCETFNLQVKFTL